MKKLGIVAALLAAGVVVASGLFAQEVKFNGYVNSGFGVVTSTEEDAPDPYVAAYGVNSWNPYRIYLDGSYTNEEGNAGALIRLRAGGGFNFITLPIAYGWFSAFDKLLTVKGGIVDDVTWATFGEYHAPDNGEGLGALVKLTPIEGLDIGVGAYVKEIPPEGVNNATISGGNYVTELADIKYTFNLGYTLPDLVKVIATLRTPSKLEGAVLASRAQASVSVLAVPGLKAIVEVVLDNLQDFKDMDGIEADYWGGTKDKESGKVIYRSGTAGSGNISFDETIQYNMGNLSVGLWSVQWLTQAEKIPKGAKTEDAALALYLNPWVSYALGSTVPRLDIGYGSAVRANFNHRAPNTDPKTNTEKPFLDPAREWRYGGYTPTYDSDTSVISIRPSIKINLDSNTFVEIGDLINIDGQKDNLAWDGEDSRISNVFYVDFKWSF